MVRSPDGDLFLVDVEGQSQTVCGSCVLRTRATVCSTSWFICRLPLGDGHRDDDQFFVLKQQKVKEA
jgi:hypothetical protein